MEYELSDSSGTDDDLPSSHQNRFQRSGRAAGNGRSGVAGTVPFPLGHNDMEIEIHHIEQEAYCSVLRAFKAQSDAITWDKESLITELRKELRVSDEEHRELLLRVDGDDAVRRISEWRKVSSLQSSMRSSSQPIRDSMPSPTVSASRKKQKTSQSAASLSIGAAPPSLQQNFQQTSSAFKRGSAPGPRGKKPKSSMQYPPADFTGRDPVANQGSSGRFFVNEHTEATTIDSLIGRKVWTRWPADNSFYEAVITDYKEGCHALMYDINTGHETWEWVNLNEISPEDIRWDDDPGISHGVCRNGPGRGVKKAMGRGGATVGAGRGRGASKGQPKKGFASLQNGIRKKSSSDIEILHTDTLITEVEKIFSSGHPDPVDIDTAKKVLKDHEQALIDAIARLEDASDGESDEGQPQLQLGWKRQYDESRGEGKPIEGPDGERMGGEAGVASDNNGGKEL